jgi:hypothetical protein
MFSPGKNYKQCFEDLDYLRKNKKCLELDSPLDLPSLIARNHLKNEYYSLRLAKTCVIINAISDVQCLPRPLPTIYLFGPDLFGEEESIRKSGYFLDFAHDWKEVNGFGWNSEHLGLNLEKEPELLARFEEHRWLQDAVAKIDELTTDEIIRIAYDFVLQRSDSNGSKRILGLEAFSETSIGTIARNFSRARVNHLVKTDSTYVANDKVSISEIENDLNSDGYSNDDSLKIGPDNHLLTLMAIHFLNTVGWEANLKSLMYLLSCNYLRLMADLVDSKRRLKSAAGNQWKSVREKVQHLLEEKSRLEKSVSKFVRTSAKALVEQDVIAEIGGRYFALGNQIETPLGKVVLDSYLYFNLYSSYLQRITEINRLIWQKPAYPQPLSRSKTRTIYMPKVYVASTCYDFRDLRREVEQALREWRYRPYLNEGSDYVVKVGVGSYQACIEAVKQSDCLVLIIGTRYGGIADYYGMSITELEYRTACEAGIPRINFCLNEVWNLAPSVRKNPSMTYPDHFHEGKDRADRIFRFLDYVRKYEEGKTDNWVHPFRDSVQLKEILRKRLQQTFPKEEL